MDFSAVPWRPFVMQDTAPPVIKNAGEMVFPDFDDPPMAIKLLVTLGFCWIVFGPILVFMATRRGRIIHGFAIYALGSALGIAIFLIVVWAEPFFADFAHRFGVLWRHGVWELFAYVIVAGGIAAVLGRISLARRPGGPGPRLARRDQ